MLQIKILGTGCAKCNALEKLTRKAVDELNMNAVIEKVGDITEILKYEVLRTPALVIDGKVVTTGYVPTMIEMKSLLLSKAVKL